VSFTAVEARLVTAGKRAPLYLLFQTMTSALEVVLNSAPELIVIEKQQLARPVKVSRISEFAHQASAEPVKRHVRDPRNQLEIPHIQYIRGLQ